MYIGVMALIVLSLLGSRSAHADADRPPESSKIVKIYETASGEATRGAANASPQIKLDDYARPDVMGYVYSGQFALVPSAGLDNLRYYAQSIADLNMRCPALGLDSAKYDLLPYILAGSGDYVRRLMSGKLDQSEIAQTMWMGVLALNQNWACNADALSAQPSTTAQAQCESAQAGSAAATVLPSPEATHDIKLFLGRYGCRSAEAQRLARQLVAFGQQAPAQMQFSRQMPAPDSAEGRQYTAIFNNCSRSTFDPAHQAWCGCYVRALHSISPPSAVVAALAENPFVDGASYMTWVAAHVAGGRALYECEDVDDGSDWRRSRAPRTTACLIDRSQAPAGGWTCRFRAAWGEFTRTSDQCAASISSHSWGFQEVDCAQAGALVAAVAGPRTWRRGGWTMVDYEGDVPADFVPALPNDAAAHYPISVRMLNRHSTGMLVSIDLVPPTPLPFYGLGMPMSEDIWSDIAAIDREKQLMLVCNYQGNGGIKMVPFWYERIPDYVSKSQAAPSAQKYLARVEGPATTCPAKLQ